MNLIGTDMSIAECRNSGYPVVRPQGKTFNPDRPYDLTISNPENWSNGAVRKKKDRLWDYRYSGFTSYKELWRQFERQGDGIKSYCDFENCPLPTPDQSPDYYAFLHLAGTLINYCGID